MLGDNLYHDSERGDDNEEEDEEQLEVPRDVHEHLDEEAEPDEYADEEAQLQEGLDYDEAPQRSQPGQRKREPQGVREVHQQVDQAQEEVVDVPQVREVVAELVSMEVGLEELIEEEEGEDGDAEGLGKETIVFLVNLLEVSEVKHIKADEE